jgi:type IV fimbrial biogenesis protein FimT
VYAAAGGVGSYQLFVDNVAPEDMNIDGGEPILSTIAMPKGVSLISASFKVGGANPPKQAAGFDGRGLPAESFIGNIQLRTSNRWYRISLSIAGNVTMEKSGDGGITWSK